MKEQVTKFVFKTFVLLGRPQKFSSGLKRVNMVNSVAIWVYLNVFHQIYQRATLVPEVFSRVRRGASFRRPQADTCSAKG